MAMKKSAQVVREELRELNAAANDVGGVNANEWFTPEFWATATTVVTNLVAVGVLFGWVRATDAETLTAVLTSLLTATSVIVTNGLMVWKFISSRTAVKEAMIDARFRYMEAVAVEKMRAEKE